MRALPASLGKWKHGVYYHLAYLGGNLSKQLTHTVTPEVIADQFQRIVQAGATEYMLVNVSELRDYVMGARMIADICWDAPAIYGSPRAADRYIGWWTREYFPQAASAAAYHRYFFPLDQPDTLWTAMDRIQDLIGRLSGKVAGEVSGGLDRDALAQLDSRTKLLDQALDAEDQAERQLPLAARQFLSIDPGLGLRIAQRQSHAALELNEALRAPDPARMWPLVFEARTSLEQLETELARGEYPPFERWYHESWIRSAIA